MNVNCGAPVCPIILSSKCVFYEGPDLVYTGITTNDNLEDALQKINAAIGFAETGYAYQNGVHIETSNIVELGGSLLHDTHISGVFTLSFDGFLQAAKFITTGGLASQFVKGDGSLDPTVYQIAGNYITALTGDGTASGPGSSVLTLSTVNANPGTYGDSGTVPVVTVNNKGLVTSVTTTAINYPSQSVSIGGDITANGFTGAPITATLQTVNPNVFGTNSLLKFAVNGKGLVTSAALITSLDLDGIYGYTPVPPSRTLTINGQTYDLSANRTWTINSITTITVNAPLSSTGGYTPVISISQANSTTDGYLSSVDWNTFNNKLSLITGSAPIVITGGNNVTISKATNAVDGYLSAIDWNTFNNKQGAITLTTIGSAGPATLVGNTLNIPNYTPLVSYVTAVTASSPLSSSGGTSPNISIQIANGSQDGYLSSVDWNTFNNKQSALTFGNLTDSGTDGITVTNGTGAVIGTGTSISQQVANASQNGYLSSTDWNTFNNKQAAGNYITALTGDATASGPGSAVLTLATVNANVYAANTFLKFAVNGKGLIISATPVLSADIISALGYTPYNATNPANYITLASLSATAPIVYSAGNFSLDTTKVPYIPGGFSNGFLKWNGASWIFDNSTYLTTTAAASTYLALAGGTMTGNLILNADATLSLQAVTLQQLNAAVLGVYKLQGGYNPTITSLYPVAANTTNPVSAIVKQGMIWSITADGTINGIPVFQGDEVVALVDSPGQTNANWNIIDRNIGYTPLSNVLTSSYIFVGNASNIATGVAMTGDVTINNTGVTTISNNAVTYGKIQQASASTLLGNPTGSTANVQEITLGSGLSFVGSVLTLGSAFGAWSLASGGLLSGPNVVIGSTTNTIKFQFNTLGSTQTNGAGLWLQNTTAAAAGAQQISPSITLEGQGWKTQAVAASESVKFTSYVTPLQALTVPQGSLDWYSSINNAAYTKIFSLFNSGAATLQGTLTVSVSAGTIIIGNGIISATGVGGLSLSTGSNALLLNNGTQTGQILIGNSATTGITVTTANGSAMLFSVGTDGISDQYSIQDVVSGQVVTFGQHGFSYSADYSGTFVTYSLVDKNYVDTHVHGSPLGTNWSTALAANLGTGWTTVFALPYVSPVTSVTASSPLASTGGTTPNITIQVANGSQNGYLSSTDWTTFNGKENVLTFSSPLVRTGNTISIPAATALVNGYLTSTDWSTFNSKQNALTFGSISTSTTGVTVTNGANSTVGPNVTINIATASGSLTGLLSSTDWTTFNNKQNALTFGNLTDAGTDGITITNGTGAVIGTGTSISQHVADATHNGYLASADWVTFNAKQAAITLTVTGNNGSATLVGATLNIPTYTLAGLGGISLTSLSATAPLSYNNGTGVFSISQATTSTNGYLTSTDWNTFNNKQGTITLTTTGTSGAATLIGNTLNIPNYAVTGGTVTSFSAGTLSPLFTTSVATATTTPALSFALSNAGANTYFGNATGSAAAPSYTAAGALTSVNDTNITLTLGGNPATSLLRDVSLTLGWTGVLAVGRGGTGTSTAFTQGSVVFAGASGVYSQDNAKFFWDDTNFRLGIGTNSPQQPLHVLGFSRFESVAGVKTEITGATVNTTTNAQVTLQTIAIPTDSVMLIESRVTARKTGGTGAGTTGDGNAYIRAVKAKNVGGTVTIGTVQSSFTSADIGPPSVTFIVSGTNVLLVVNGANNDNITWNATTLQSS